MKTCWDCRSGSDEKAMKCCSCHRYRPRGVRLRSVLIVFVGFLILVSGGHVGNKFRIGSDTPVVRAATIHPHEAKSIPAHFSGNGTFRVGKDIQPGTYRTRIATAGCYYARLRGFGGTFGEVIANDITNAAAIVTIDATDKGFETSRCSTWTKDISAITKNKTLFGDGNYIVGTDIKPGTYHTRVASSECYYARLRGFGGTLNDIITNTITDGVAIVTIVASDKGFQATRCGTWTRV